jgi:hypothetical protein
MANIYVFCPELNFPSGGMMKLYELVDTLNANQIQSYIVFISKGYNINWFEHSTKVTDISSIDVREDDILIFPEVSGEEILNYYPGTHKIIFCQNSFYALKMFYGKPERAKEFYLHKDIVQVIVVSDYDFELFSWIFPGIQISKITYGLDEGLFHFQPQKKLQIAVMPRKLPSDYNFLENLLKIKADLAEVPIKKIENMSYSECAAILRESAIFLSFSNREGFGLPPAEAMACGCLVIGYHGQGGKEFFQDDLVSVIDQWDMMSYAKTISNTINLIKNHPDQALETGRKASDYILAKYAKVNQEQSILQIIQPLL